MLSALKSEIRNLKSGYVVESPLIQFLSQNILSENTMSVSCLQWLFLWLVVRIDSIFNDKC